MVLLIPDDEALVVPDDFLWITLGQLQSLMDLPNLVHLDSRSILGSLTFSGDPGEAVGTSSGFGRRILGSMLATGSGGALPAQAWLGRLRRSCRIEVKAVPLRSVVGWERREGRIQHEAGRYFSIMGVRVEAGSREVAKWDQPLIRSLDGGIIGLLCAERGGVLHFLIQALAEPGLIDGVELAPTVQFNPLNYPAGCARPRFAELFLEPAPASIRFDAPLSEEGGRFYHSQQRHLVIEAALPATAPVPENYRWLTLGEIYAAGRTGSLLNIELRSILSALSPAGAALS